MRKRVENRGDLRRMLVVAVVALMGIGMVSLVVPGSSTAPSTHAQTTTSLAQFHIAKLKAPVSHAYEFSNGYVADGIAADGYTVCLVNALDNGSYAIVLWDSKTNTTLPGGQPWVAGGSGIAPVSLVAAGGGFYIDWYNTTTGTPIWNFVTLSGTVSTVYPALSANIGTNILWDFTGGSATTVWVSSGIVPVGGYLVELRAPALTLVRNYSAYLPTATGIPFVFFTLLEGTTLYYTGYAVSTTHCNTYTCAGNKLFGAQLTKSPYTDTVINAPTSNHNAKVLASWEGLTYVAPFVYVSGFELINSYSPAYELKTTQGYFGEYNTMSSTFTDLSSKLFNHWGVPAIEPWGKNILLTSSYFLVNATVYFTEPGYTKGGFYLWNPCTSMMSNVTKDFPAHYVDGSSYITAEQNGWFITGGFDSATGYGEIVALKV